MAVDERFDESYGGSTVEDVMSFPTAVAFVEAPPEVEAWLVRRRRLGQDLLDEVWEGEYLVVPGPATPHADIDNQLAVVLTPLARAVGLRPVGVVNVGTEDDYRVPDRAFLRDRRNRTFEPTAAIVVEILSPRDRAMEKLPFYARHGVEEVLLVDPYARTVRWLAAEGDGFVETDASALLGISAAELADQLDWPPLD